MNEKSTPIRWLIATTMTLLTLGSAPSWAGWHKSTEGSVHLTQANKGIDKSQAAQIAKRAYGGEVIDVKKSSKDGRTVYRVKLNNGGRIKIVRVDAGSGDIL